MKIAELVSGLFRPAADLVDNLHTSEEEKMRLEQAMLETKINVALEVLEYEKQLLKGQTDIVIAEAQGGSVLQRSWRPVTMLTFLSLVVLDSFGWLVTPLADEAWVLLQIGLGGYVAGRSLEKTVPMILSRRNEE